jgi:hypothetical protein
MTEVLLSNHATCQFIKKLSINVILRSYPMILELVVETTYPADESIMLAAIAMSSALQGFFVIVMNHALSKPIDLQGQVEVIDTIQFNTL